MTQLRSNYHGFTLTYYTVGSYYTSTQSSGPSGPNSYKFGRDSCSIITPDLTGYDSISFWMKKCFYRGVQWLTVN
ncbi:MAG: hypothetical protein IPP27_13975 [Bacteroidetes bacterium]|nr:hypothetical protein [Bacteroidota bacterium]